MLWAKLNVMELRSLSGFGYANKNTKLIAILTKFTYQLGIVIVAIVNSMCEGLILWTPSNKFIYVKEFILSF